MAVRSSRFRSRKETSRNSVSRVADSGLPHILATCSFFGFTNILKVRTCFTGLELDLLVLITFKMDFNVKKLVGDAGTLFTRAVQVN